MPTKPALVPAEVEILLSVREVAAALSVSTATVYKLVDRGQLAHRRVLNAIRIRPADLAAFIASSERGPKS